MDQEARQQTPWAQTLAVEHDVRESVPEGALVRLLLEAMHRTTVDEHLPVGRPRVLLGLLTYSYATARYSSELIESEIEHDPELLYLAARLEVTSPELRQFRRHHRACVERTLATLFESVICSHADWPRAFHDLGAQCAHAATERVNEAVLRDTMALDV